jgi:hypothetical protein
VTRTFRDGHAETWFAADATLGWWGPDGARRLVVATADPATLPRKATWFLVMNLPRPGGPREAGSPHPAAGLAEITRIYGIRNWIEHQVRRRDSWYRWTTLAMLALAFLTITAATEHASSPPAAGHIPLTRNEIAALFSTLIIEPVTDARHRLRWSAWRRRRQHRDRSCHYQRQARQP